MLDEIRKMVAQVYDPNQADRHVDWRPGPTFSDPYLLGVMDGEQNVLRILARIIGGTQF